MLRHAVLHPGHARAPTCSERCMSREMRSDEALSSCIAASATDDDFLREILSALLLALCALPCLAAATLSGSRSTSSV
eukprot:6624368-Prymnesium_polylepis.2